MVVTGTNGGVFCKDFGAVLLTAVPGPVRIDYTIRCRGVSDSFSENYAPDAEGKVRISDLGELALCYFEDIPFALDSEVASYPCTAMLTAAVYGESGEALGEFSQKFFYANCRTNIAEPYKFAGFLGRHRRRKIRVGQAQFVGYFNYGQHPGIGVSYRDGNSKHWIEFALPATASDGNLCCRNVGLDEIVSLLSGQDTAGEPSAGDIDYYIVYLKSNGQVVDAIQFDVDRTYHSVMTHFVYYNCFGIPDTLYFTGKDTRTSELDATFATIQRRYLKINTRYNIFHDVNTGFINETLRDCVEDLIASNKVHLYDGTKLGDMITVTDVEFDESRPRTEPINVRFKYRLSAECQRSIDRNMNIDYRIFDHTFGNEFE